VPEHELAEALLAAERISEEQAVDRRQVERALESVVADFIARWCRGATD
jgi:hypothetical protein